MAKKSKTQRAKASAARQARKAERERVEAAAEVKKDTALEDALAKKAEAARAAGGEKPETASKAGKATESKKDSKKSEDSKPKKKRFQFLRDVRAEMKRVTWPTRIDVMRWSGVVVVALLFFGLFTAILDNLIVTPLLVLISGADPATVDWMSMFSFTSGVEGGGDASSAADAASSAASEA